MASRLLLFIFFLVMLNDPGISGNPDQTGKGKKYPAVYKEGVVADGNSQEWDSLVFNYNETAKVHYIVANDSDAICICFQVADEGEQMKAMTNGIELQFNSRGKKKPEATLQFPIGMRMSPELRRDRKTTHLMFLLQMQDMELTGFREEINGFQKVRSPKSGITAAVDWDPANVMVYEARIPFHCFPWDVKSSEPLSVGIVIKGAQPPRQGGGSGTTEENKPGTGERSVAGSQGRAGMEPMGGTMEGDTRLFTDDTIWRFIRIAPRE